jgi:fatty-acyl-CoA synthase
LPVQEASVFVPLTPLDFRRRALSLFGEKIGVVDGEKRFTYREFGERTNRLANALLRLGLERRDRVAYLAYNSHPLLEGYFGVLEAGGILLPLNIRLTAPEIGFILRDSGARFLIAAPDFAGLASDSFEHVSTRPQVIWLDGTVPPGAMSYEQMLAAAEPQDPPPIPVDENEVVELFYTSGTTGKPKGVMLTNRNLYMHALMGLATLPASDGDTQLHTIPLFHVNGWGTPQSLTAVGGKHVMMRRFDPGEALRLVEAERVTRFFAVPTMLNMILNHPDLGRYDLSSLGMIITGGAPTPPEMIRRAESMLGCQVISGYGLSETSPVLTCALPKVSLADEDEDTRIRRQASTGLPVVGVDLRVVDEEGGEVPRDGMTVGEIVARSNTVMEGYWNDPEGTQAVIRDGWFHTGDMAVVDEEGYVLIVDRKKDIIISGGENISSVEVEKVLFEHPAVLESAVIGVPDEQWGEVPKALVALRPGERADEAELINFCRSRIAAFKAPKSVEFLPELPKGGTGKILKARLREPYWSGREKRVH